MEKSKDEAFVEGAKEATHVRTYAIADTSHARAVAPIKIADGFPCVARKVDGFVQVQVDGVAFVSLVSIGQRVMVVENSDKTTTKILVDKINRVYFEEVEFRFEKEKVSLLEGSQVQLNLINSTGKEASWSSSNTSVASVTNTGLVSAISKGTSTITAKTDDGMECQCEIIVTDITDLISATNTGGAIMSMN